MAPAVEPSDGEEYVLPRRPLAPGKLGKALAKRVQPCLVSKENQDFISFLADDLNAWDGEQVIR
jgi:hypothetical protein